MLFFSQKGDIMTMHKCAQCEKEIKLESKFEAQVCPSCYQIVFPCGICVLKDNCLNCPLSNYDVADVYEKACNKLLSGSKYTAFFVETSELYGEDDEVEEDDPYYMMPMYEAYIADEDGEQIPESMTGRYCDPVSVVKEILIQSSLYKMAV
jgi:DNA-directed RNA polymerase subunit RPC12/RpoP